MARLGRIATRKRHGFDDRPRRPRRLPTLPPLMFARAAPAPSGRSRAARCRRPRAPRGSSRRGRRALDEPVREARRPPPRPRGSRARPRPPARAAARLTDVRSTSRAGRVSSMPATETLTRHVDAAAPQAGEQPDRHLVVDRRAPRRAARPRAGGLGRCRRPPRTRSRPAARQRVGPRHRRLEALQALGARVQTGRPLDERDPAMAERRAGARSRPAPPRGCPPARSGSRGRAARARRTAAPARLQLARPRGAAAASSPACS